MLKLILIFRSLLWPQNISRAENSFSFSLKQQFTYFLIIIQWKTGCNRDVF